MESCSSFSQRASTVGGLRFFLSRQGVRSQVGGGTECSTIGVNGAGKACAGGSTANRSRGGSRTREDARDEQDAESISALYPESRRESELVIEIRGEQTGSLLSANFIQTSIKLR